MSQKKKKKSKEVVLEDQRFSARLKTSWWGWGGETEKKKLKSRKRGKELFLSVVLKE